MYLGREELASLRRLDETTMERRASETLKGLSVTTIRSVRQTVAGLSGGQRQSVAVAKAVMWNSRVVILDEPTAALGVAQTQQVLDLVARLGEQGLAVVLISHNLHDIFQVADSITVLRLGQNVKEFKRRETNQQEVVEAITAGQLSKVPGQRGGRRMSAATAPPPARRPGRPAANTVGAYAQRWWTDVKSGELGSLPIVVGLIIIAIVFQSQNDRFLTSGNFVNLIVQTAPYAVIAMGVTFALLLGEIDLSIGFVSGVGGVLTAILLTPDGNELPTFVVLAIVLRLRPRDRHLPRADHHEDRRAVVRGHAGRPAGVERRRAAADRLEGHGDPAERLRHRGRQRLPAGRHGMDPHARRHRALRAGAAGQPALAQGGGAGRPTRR